MRTIYSLKEFREAVLKIASDIGQTYTNVRVTLDHKGKAIFECYINDKNWEEGQTMEECLQKMRNSIGGQPTISNIDVEIEIEEAPIFEETNEQNDIPW